MKEEKITFKYKRLTYAQEIFINQMILGKSKREAYRVAYPNTRAWKDASVAAAANRVSSKPEVKYHYERLLEQVKEEERERTRWTREESVATLRYVIDKNKEDMERINGAFEDELSLLLKQMEEDPARAIELTKQLIRSKKTKRVSTVHNLGITQAVSELNKMQGFNEENVNVNAAVEFTGEAELED